jgi:hypothetical protein
MQRALAAKQKYVVVLMSDPAVFGVGIGAGDSPGTTAIVILVDQAKTPRLIPAQLDGIRTRVRRTKRFRAFNHCRPQSNNAETMVPLF